MDALKVCLICTIFPVGIQLSCTSHQSMWFALFTCNPFILFLLIQTLAKPSSNARYQLRSNTQRKNVKYCAVRGTDLSTYCDTSLEESHYCCSRERDKIYTFHEYWLISVHVTLIWIVRRNLVSEHIVSPGEMALLYCSYMSLASLVLNMRLYVRRITRPPGTEDTLMVIPLSRAYAGEGDGAPDVTDSTELRNSIHCDQICYLKLLLHPLTTYKSGPSARSVSRYERVFMDFDVTNRSAGRQPAITERSYLDCDSGFIRRMAQLTSHSSRTTGKLYLTLCNIFHLFILMQNSYLNITYSCATQPSRFGLVLLVPYDCTSVFAPNGQAVRASMFAGLFAAQLVLCHLMLIAFNSRRKFW